VHVCACLRTAGHPPKHPECATLSTTKRWTSCHRSRSAERRPVASGRKRSAYTGAERYPRARRPGWWLGARTSLVVATRVWSPSTRDRAPRSLPGRQHTAAGEREVRKALRKYSLKYQLHRGADLFKRSYTYLRGHPAVLLTMKKRSSPTEPNLKSPWLPGRGLVVLQRGGPR